MSDTERHGAELTVMPHALSFSPDFFHGEPPVPCDRECVRPESVEQAIMCLSQETWAALAEEVFGVDPSQLDVETVLRRIEETNTCRNLDSPVEVFIDADGDFSVFVYEPQSTTPDVPDC
jgi:hypothetical protein